MSTYILDVANMGSFLDTNNTLFSNEVSKLAYHGNSCFLHPNRHSQSNVSMDQEALARIDKDSFPILDDWPVQDTSLLQKRNTLSVNNTMSPSLCCWKANYHEMQSVQDSRNRLSSLAGCCKTSIATQNIDLEPLSEQETTDYTEWFGNWQLNTSAHVDMSSLSGSGCNSQSSEFQ